MAHRSAGSRPKTIRVKALLEEEAEGFGVGIQDWQPTPKLR
jgi:hypothetical protein